MKGRSLHFCTLFPDYRDFHFYKDPGQIPYRFSKLGYHTTLVCYGKHRQFNVTEKYLNVRKLTDNYFTRKFNLGIIYFLFRNAGKIDILATFHLNWRSLLAVFLYKTLNRGGYAYLKLDSCAFAANYPWETDYGEIRPFLCGIKNSKRKIKNWIARKYFVCNVDLWSVEDDSSMDIYESRYGFFKGKLITVYNGHTSDLPGSVNNFRHEEKEKIILTAGRLGTFQKATEILLEAFNKIADLTEYNLHLAGSVEPSFNSYSEKFFCDNPHLINRVIFHGDLGREELLKLYSRAKIFCLPSRFEGMAIVYSEAMFYRNAIVTTKNVSIRYLIDKYNAGIMVNGESPDELAVGLLNLINDNQLLENIALNAYKLSITILNWDNIVEKLNAEIECRKNAVKL